MLEIRPSCEHCGASLPPDATDARICSFECTFCARCVAEVLDGVCPNCGGGFVPRPVRPARAWVGEASLARFPARADRVERPVDPAAQRALIARVGAIPPGDR